MVGLHRSSPPCEAPVFRTQPHLAGALLSEGRCLLEEESDGVAELRSGLGLAVLTRVDDLPATRKDREAIR